MLKIFQYFTNCTRRAVSTVRFCTNIETQDASYQIVTFLSLVVYLHDYIVL